MNIFRYKSNFPFARLGAVAAIAAALLLPPYAFPAPAAKNPPATAEEAVSRGDESFRQGRWAEAEGLYLDAAGRVPRSPPLRRGDAQGGPVTNKNEGLPQGPEALRGGGRRRPRPQGGARRNRPRILRPPRAASGAWKKRSLSPKEEEESVP